MKARTLLLYSAPRSGAGDPWMRFLPIGLGYLQAMLKSHGFPCRIANLSGKSKREVLDYLKAHPAEVVGVSLFTFNRHRGFELLAWAREALPQALLLAGGPHPTHCAAEVLADSPALDAVVKGEGERTLLAMVQNLAAWTAVPGLVTRAGETPDAPPVEDLDELGLPVEHAEADFLDAVDHLAYLSTSRGCPAKCSFCNTPRYWGSRVRYRSADSVLREMGLLRERHGLIYFSFRDDTFTTRKDRLMSLMAGIQASGQHPVWNCQSRVNLVDEERLVAMKRAGCEFIQFGVEHGSPRILQQLDKGVGLDRIREALALTRRVGLNLGIYLITGIPGETWEDVQQSAELVRQTLPHDVQIAPLAIYPGTRVYEDLRAQGRIDGGYFAQAGDAELFARVDVHTEKALRHLEEVAERTRSRAAYTPRDFAEQKRWLGFCAVTNLLCGEAAESAGRPLEALAEYAEVISREPGNPWGFLKRALLLQRLGKAREADGDLREVLRLAPGNPEAEAARAHEPRKKRKNSRN